MRSVTWHPGSPGADGRENHHAAGACAPTGCAEPFAVVADFDTAEGRAVSMLLRAAGAMVLAGADLPGLDPDTPIFLHRHNRACPVVQQRLTGLQARLPAARIRIVLSARVPSRPAAAPFGAAPVDPEHLRDFGISCLAIV